MRAPWSDEQPVRAPGYPQPVYGAHRRVPVFHREEHAVKRTWTVKTKDGARVHTGGYDVDGEVVHAYGQWRECHLDQGGRR